MLSKDACFVEGCLFCRRISVLSKDVAITRAGDEIPGDEAVGDEIVGDEDEGTKR